MPGAFNQVNTVLYIKDRVQVNLYFTSANQKSVFLRRNMEPHLEPTLLKLPATIPKYKKLY